MTMFSLPFPSEDCLVVLAKLERWRLSNNFPVEGGTIVFHGVEKARKLSINFNLH